MLDIILIIFWGLVLLTSIVFVHELGHFLAARIFGRRVKEFMIGLPGPKIKFKRKGTYYGATAIPLGGYCSIAGMEQNASEEELENALSFITYFGCVCTEEAERASDKMGVDLLNGLDCLADWGTVRRERAHGLRHYTIAAATIDGISYEEGECRKIADPTAFLASEKALTYTALPFWKRIIILLGGSLSNLIVAMAVLIVIFMISGMDVTTTTVDTVTDNAPAAEAGILAGDELVSLNGEYIDSWVGFVTAVQGHDIGSTVELGYRHEGEDCTAIITLADNEGNPFVGVAPRIVHESIDFFTAAQFSLRYISVAFLGILQLFNPTTFADTIDNATSVVGISVMASSAASVGPLPFIMLAALLSVSIGLMNLLPIPPLDGGKIVVETIERISRRRLPISVVNSVSLVGFGALILLFIVATYGDINLYFLGG